MTAALAPGSLPAELLQLLAALMLLAALGLVVALAAWLLFWGFRGPR